MVCHGQQRAPAPSCCAGAHAWRHCRAGGHCRALQAPRIAQARVRKKLCGTSARKLAGTQQSQVHAAAHTLGTQCGPVSEDVVKHIIVPSPHGICARPMPNSRCGSLTRRKLCFCDQRRDVQPAQSQAHALCAVGEKRVRGSRNLAWSAQLCVTSHGYTCQQGLSRCS